MSEAPAEKIAKELVQRIEQITTANGYAMNVADVRRVTRNNSDWSPRHLSVVVVQGDEIPNEQYSHEGNPPVEAYSLDFLIHAFVRLSDRSTEPPAVEVNAFVTSIRKAITQAATWWSFGGVAIDAQVQQVTPYFAPEDDHQGATMTLGTIYRVSETDPFAVRV